MSEDRLDRMEALAEQILEGLKETKQATNDLVEGLKETKQTTNNLVEGLKETKQTTNNLVEGLKETRQETREFLEGLKETKQLTDSNARAIEALTAQASEDRKHQEKDRKGIYLLLGQLTRSTEILHQYKNT